MCFLMRQLAEQGVPITAGNEIDAFRPLLGEVVDDVPPCVDLEMEVPPSTPTWQDYSATGDHGPGPSPHHVAGQFALMEGYGKDPALNGILAASAGLASNRAWSPDFGPRLRAGPESGPHGRGHDDR